jgi:hypothetical protein
MRSTTGDSRFSHSGASPSTTSMMPSAEPRINLLRMPCMRTSAKFYSPNFALTALYEARSKRNKHSEYELLFLAWDKWPGGRCAARLGASKIVHTLRRSGAATKANPPRGGGAKPKGLPHRREVAGLPNGGGDRH